MLQELGDVDKRLRLLQEAAAAENPLLALKQLGLGKSKGAIHLGYVRALQVCRGERQQPSLLLLSMQVMCTALSPQQAW